MKSLEKKTAVANVRAKNKDFYHLRPFPVLVLNVYVYLFE